MKTALRHADPPIDRRPPRAARRAFARRAPARSRRARRAFQTGFLLLNVWLGVQFYLFVHYYEAGGAAIRVGRPPGVEGWLPIAGLMSLKVVLLTGRVPALHPAGLFLLIAFLAVSFGFRKAFCSWLCPVGTVSEWLWQAGRRMWRRNLTPPAWLDVALRSLKYLLLAFFVWAIADMSADAIEEFLRSPYGLIADVKMLDFFRDLGPVGLSVLLALAGLSLVIKNVWCRYLCPYGALLGLVALPGPTHIHRRSEACIDCGRCATACPSLLKVDRLVDVRSAECTGCLECVAACPAAGALDLEIGHRWVVSYGAVAAGIGLVLAGLVTYARLSGHWHTTLPDATYFDLIPNAHLLAHPPAG